MTFDEFEAAAWRYWEEIPEHYKEGVDGLLVERKRVLHPELADVFTLGECLTESYPSEFGGPDTTRSFVALYHGSFQAVSRRDEAFDWERELWETLVHELQHHLESLAAESGLEDVDYAADENFRRLEGDAFEPFFYRSGEKIREDLYRVEGEWFLELREVAEHEPGSGGGEEMPGARAAHFVWDDVRYAVALPRDRGDVCFIEVSGGLEVDGVLTLVLLRRRGFWETVRAMFGGRLLRVVEADAPARAEGAA